MQIDLIFFLIVLIVSVILHELAHGYTANYLGDPTARLAGRLTFNPLKHVDVVGTILLPLLLFLSHSPVLIGYAKPVPYNPFNLRGRHAETMVAFAGPMVNILLAVFFGLLVRIFSPEAVGILSPLLSAFSMIAFVNMLLALFNLIPVPPLDGSKVLSGILPGKAGVLYDRFKMRIESLGVFTNVLVVLVLFYVFAPFFGVGLNALFRVLTGL